MCQNRKKRFTSLLLIMGLLGTVAASGENAEAAKKPKMSKKTVKLSVGKSAVVKVKGVKAKKIKKLTAKSSSKKIATVKKQGKTGVRIQGKKEGKATVTVKVKVGKKTTSCKVKVTVKKAAQPVPQASPSVSAAPSNPAAGAPVTAAPTAAPRETAVPVTPAPTASEQPTPTPEPTPLVSYSEGFENGAGQWYARYNEADNTAAGADTKVTVSEEGHTGKALLVSGRNAGWNGPAMDLSASLTENAEYSVSFWAKIPAGDEAESLNLRVSGAYKMVELQEESYSNYSEDDSYPIRQDAWTKVETTFTAPFALYQFVLYLDTDGSDKVPFLIDDFTMERVSAPPEYDASLPSLKDTYGPKGLDTIGVGTGVYELMNKNIRNHMKHHYNSITYGNEMKPDAMLGGAADNYTLDAAEAAEYYVSDRYKAAEGNTNGQGQVVVPAINFDGLDQYLKIAKDNGFKLRYHTFVWQQQMPKRFFTEGFDAANEFVGEETMLARVEMYVHTVMKHILEGEYADVLYTVDVANEYTHRNDVDVNYWKNAFGAGSNRESTYVKTAFVSAYDELEKHGREQDVTLIYNDYNTYQNGVTDDIIALIQYINQTDELNPEGKKLCAGVGMQGHFNDSTASPESFAFAIQKFKEAGFEIQVTELDVTKTGKVTEDTDEDDKAEIYADNAELYGEIMNVLLEEKKAGANITSITFWGTCDAVSWRRDRAPLLFGKDVSDKKPSFDAVIQAAVNFQVNG